jgi:uncharacterized protein HemX
MDIMPPAAPQQKPEETTTPVTPVIPEPVAAVETAPEPEPIHPVVPVIPEPVPVAPVDIAPTEGGKGAKTALIVVVSVIIASLITGLAVYAWQTSSQANSTDITNLRAQNATLTQANATLTAQNKSLAAQVVKQATATATPTPTAAPSTTPKVILTPKASASPAI